MKKKLTGILAMVLALFMLLCSCGQDVVESSSEAQKPTKKVVDQSVYNSLIAAEELTEVKSVRMGGGGYVTGMVIHPKNYDLRYIRTDVGGCYRWKPDTKEWIQLCSTLIGNYYGVAGLAVDPNDQNVVYIAAGNGSISDVLKSTDQGATWSATLFGNAHFNGNGGYKTLNDCIMVDPNNSNVVLCGTQGNGAYFNLEAGAPKKWEKANFGNGKDAVTSVCFDPTSKRNGRSQIIYAVSYGIGIYKSMDAGKTWVIMDDSPKNAASIKCTDNGVTYCVDAAAVYKLVGNKWVSVTDTLEHYQGRIRDFKNFTVDPKNSQRLAICTQTNYRVAGSDATTYDPMQLPIYYSSDGGASWTLVSGGTRKGTVPWWPGYYFSSATASMNFGKGDSFFFTDWYGTWETNSVSSPDRVWTNPELGHEEMVCFSAMTTPNEDVNVYFAQADNGIIRYTEEVTTYPSSDNHSGNGQRMDYYPKNPKFVLAGGGTSNSGTAGCVMYSEDAGLNWTTCSGWEGKLVTSDVAICAESPSIFVAIAVNSVPYYSFNKGRTWTKSQGAPTGTYQSYWNRGSMLAADRVKGNVFYLLTTKGFYRSDDWGATWNCVNKDVSLISGSAADVITVDGHEGEIWVGAAGNGTWHSTDFGETFTKIDGINGGNIAIGAPKDENSPNTLWYCGTLGTNKTALYYSTDEGKSFTKVTDYKQYTFAMGTGIYGDVKNFGRVYVATSGTGWWYVDIAKDNG